MKALEKVVVGLAATGFALGTVVVVLVLAVVLTSTHDDVPVVTKAEFLSLSDGMSYQQAVRVVGEPGEVISRSDVAGITTVMYGWQNTDGSNMNVMFQDDALVQKAQFGLK